MQLWEKRCGNVSEDERGLWNDVKPSMMSEEESDPGDPQVLLRRRPSWRSEQFNEMVNTLDARTTTKSVMKRRIPGPPLEVPPIPSVANWMVRQPPDTNV